MADKKWKKRERQVADYFGTRRSVLSGGNSHGTRSDSLHTKLFIECKLRVKHTVVTLWQDIKAKAIVEGKVPVIALCEKNRKGFWVVVHADDLLYVADELRGILHK